jgi:hypothetical protein
MSQTTYSNDLSLALPGQLDGDGADAFEIASAAAFEDIEPGRALVLRSDGKVEYPKNAGALPTSGAGSLFGVSCLNGAMPPYGSGSVASYKAGDMVPCLRRGRVVAQTVGTAPTPLATSNISHSSTVATDRGKFTIAATSTGAGTEVSASPRSQFRTGAQGTNLALLDINLP